SGGAPALAQPDDGVVADPEGAAIPDQEPAPDPDEAAGPLVHEVAEGDWMWHIAGRYLGDELRYPEIAALNPGLAQRYADYPDHIEPGDQLVLPPDAYDRGERRHATGDPAPAEEPGTAPEGGGPAPSGPDGGEA